MFLDLIQYHGPRDYALNDTIVFGTRGNDLSE